MVLLPTLMVALFGGPLGVGSIIKYLDEIIIIIMHVHIFFLLRERSFRVKVWPLICYAIFWGWNIFLIIVNKLPIPHLIQIAISGQCFVYFMFYYYLKDKSKVAFLKKTEVVLFILFYSSSAFAVLQIAAPDIVFQILPVRMEERGFWGASLNSFFSSRVFYADFLLVFIMYLAFISKPAQRYQMKWIYYHLFSAMIFIFLTASRKEMFFSLMLLLVVLTDMKIKRTVLLIPILVPSVFLFATMFIRKFSEINKVATSDGYVRFHIFNFAMEITKDYFPLGSGPGTFGSIMSVSYQVVYEYYGVGENILGFEGKERGPIFDLFISSTLAELGLGFFIFVIFFYKILKKGREHFSETNKQINRFFLFSIILLVYLSLMTPVLNNWVGFILLALMGSLLFDVRTTTTFTHIPVKEYNKLS